MSEDSKQPIIDENRDTVPAEIQRIIGQLGPEAFKALAAYIQTRLGAQNETGGEESTLESIYKSEEFKIIKDSLYEDRAEEDLENFKSLVDHYLAAGNEDSLAEEVWNMYNFIQSSTTLSPDDKTSAYNNIINKLNSVAKNTSDLS